ncbi:hypothetical protein PFISCL1PPCAC_25985 [Pristionchus fissidentatus]|uniref:BTB domain-containing protein n=1 Tax=Pristionchus fissidentatus TaxID=1538716 RepID=A0AAV5WVJ0_9BILA|nr:hypothetical protein PFISCL1PPCAC_25985 [Pristionchus fissidentatus]
MPTIAEIYSECLKIGSIELAVSRELLAIRSDYFSTLFYGSYLEKNQEVKEIKDIAESEFVDFIQMLHRRRFAFTSVRSALDALVFADQFLMPDISVRVMPYLSGKALSDDLFECAVISADRVPNSDEILAWILPQFPSKLKLLEVLHDALPSISAGTAQICLVPAISEQTIIADLEKSVSEHKTRIVDIVSALAGTTRSTHSVFQIKYYETSGKPLETEEHMSLQCMQNGAHIVLPIWDTIPTKYTRIIIGGNNRKRGDVCNMPAGGLHVIEAYAN